MARFLTRLADRFRTEGPRAPTSFYNLTPPASILCTCTTCKWDVLREYVFLTRQCKCMRCDADLAEKVSD